MAESPRKKSPRAPSVSLDEALDRALKAYDKERLHPAPTEVVAQNIGYKSANNGAALATMASLRYYGLLERPKEGLLAVSKDVESFRFAPDEQLRRSLLVKFLRQPQLFAELLDKYTSGLPSDANLKYELLQRGFIPQAAESVLVAFKRSVEFSGFFQAKDDALTTTEEGPSQLLTAVMSPESATPLPVSHVAQPTAGTHLPTESSPSTPQAPFNWGPSHDDDGFDRIPVRLPRGRRAWLLIPSPFFSSDKARLKAQIDLLLTDDEEEF